MINYLIRSQEMIGASWSDSPMLKDNRCFVTTSVRRFEHFMAKFKDIKR